MQQGIQDGQRPVLTEKYAHILQCSIRAGFSSPAC